MSEKVGKFGLSDYVVIGSIVIVAGISIRFVYKQIKKLDKDKKAIQTALADSPKKFEGSDVKNMAKNIYDNAKIAEIPFMRQK